MQEENTTPDSARKETTSQMQTNPQRYSRVLFRHEPHQYQPRNVNLLHETE
jgi:hypothetical protein